MEPQTAPENGYKTVKMLPPLHLPTGQDVPHSADLANGILLSLWALDNGETYGRHMVAALGGQPVTVRAGRGRRTRETPRPAQPS